MTLYQHAHTLYNHFPFVLRPFIILGGGCLRAYHDGTAIKDIDCFFRNKGDYEDTRVELGRSRDYVLRKDGGRFCEYTYLPDGMVINLVGFEFGSPREHLERFDFRCCQFVAWWTAQGDLHVDYNLDAPNDAQDKLLYIVNNNGTERTLRRIRHYVEDYGYTLHPDQDVEQADAFEDRFSEFDACRPQGVSPSAYREATPDWLKTARRRVSALPVQSSPYAEN